MRGLIYKDITIFFKDIDKRLILLVIGVIALLMVNTGVYAGIFASVMLAMTIGMQNIMSFASDEKADWKKYQLAMPVSTASVVAGKYISVICTLAVSLVGSILLNLLPAVVFQSFHAIAWGVSVAAALIIPLLWTGICLPFTYWFGFRTAQTMGLLTVIPMVYFIKYFEDGAGFSAMTSSVTSYAVVAGAAVIVFFGLSMIVSMIGYNKGLLQNR